MSDQRCMNAHTLKDELTCVQRIPSWHRLVWEPKIDGVRLLIVGGRPMSRAGKPLAHLDRILDQLRAMMGAQELKAWVFDGELWAGSWSETVSIVRAMKSPREIQQLRYLIFDVVPIGHWAVRQTWTEPQERRRRQLGRLISESRNVALVTQDPFSVHRPQSWAQARTMLKEAEAMGYEGLMAKERSAPYEFKRSWGWMKVISRPTETVTVCEVLRGKGKHANRCGKLRCRTAWGTQIKVDGMSDVLRDAWWARPSLIVGHDIDVTYKEKTEAGKLRQPKYVRIREEADR